MSSTPEADVSRTKAWLMAARPQTLPAAAAPVVVGSGVAAYDGVFAPLPALFALLGAALIQVGTNFANDYYDAVKGADTDDREGFTRVTAGGLIDAAAVKRAMAATFAVAIVSGVYLVYVGGPPIVAVGLLGIASGILYTGGPYPLGYHGLGDLFVFVWFGVVAVTGTYYVQAVETAYWLSAGTRILSLPADAVSTVAVVASLPVAAISTDILVVNNVRDRETDAATGKRTVAVIFGYAVARGEFVAMLLLAYCTPVALVAGFDVGPAVLAPLLTLPLAGRLTHTVLTETGGDALNPALERTGKLLFAYSVLFAAGFALAGGVGV
jgi:1,4-dihydroxy-2-naphthoate octaprenyltransferase